MAPKKKQSFSTVQEVIKNYFPSYSKQRHDSIIDEDVSRTGLDLATELGEEFQHTLEQAVSGAKGPSQVK